MVIVYGHRKLKSSYFGDERSAQRLSASQRGDKKKYLLLQC
jgi:hypothetical protein